MDRYIVGFKTEQDVRLTLAAMEKKGWKWLINDLPTQWDGWKNSSGDYSNLSLLYGNHFGQSLFASDGVNNINFKDAIRELDGTRTSTVCEPKKITDHNDLENYLGRNFTGKIDGKDITGTIKKASGYPTLYFNYVDGTSSSVCWGTNREINGVKYTRGWHIGDASDLDRFRDIVITPEEVFTEQLPVTAIYTINKLPKYFTISSKHNTHPLWKKYIDWLNKKTDRNWKGNSDGFYGVHKNRVSFNHDYEMQGEKEITLEEWDRIVNRPSIATQYEKLVSTAKKITTEDRFDPCSRMRYPIRMEPQLTPYVMSNPDLVAEATDYMRGESARTRTATGASTRIKPSPDGLIDEMIKLPMADTAFETAQKIQKANRATVDIDYVPTRIGMSYPEAPAPVKKGSRYSDMISNI